MKRILVALIVLFVFFNLESSMLKNGGVLTFTTNFKYMEFTEVGYGEAPGSNDFSNMIIKFTNISENRIELNLVGTFLNGSNVRTDNKLINFKRYGIGVEIGKVISIKTFEIQSQPVFLDFVLGLYGVFNIKDNKTILEDYRDPLSLEEEEKNSQFQIGLYTSARFVIPVKKLRLLIGYQINVPISSAEYSQANSLQLIKSYGYIGIVF